MIDQPYRTAPQVEPLRPFLTKYQCARSCLFEVCGLHRGNYLRLSQQADSTSAHGRSDGSKRPNLGYSGPSRWTIKRRVGRQQLESRLRSREKHVGLFVHKRMPANACRLSSFAELPLRHTLPTGFRLTGTPKGSPQR